MKELGWFSKLKSWSGTGTKIQAISTYILWSSIFHYRADHKIVLSASILGFILFFCSNNSVDGLTGTGWIEPKTFKVRFLLVISTKKKQKTAGHGWFEWSYRVINRSMNYVRDTAACHRACPETVFELNHPCNHPLMLLNNKCQSLSLTQVSHKR